MLQVHNLAVLLIVGLLCLQCLTLLCAADPQGSRCPSVKGRETCVCQHKTGSMIDLSSLGRTDGSPRFTNLRDENAWLYSYNPCKPYSSSPCGANVHVCQTLEALPEEFHTVADGGTEEMWLDTDGTPYLYYTGPEDYPGSGIRETMVYFHCDKSATTPVATTNGDVGHTLHYTIDVRTAEACKVPLQVPATGVAPGEVGIVLIVLLIVGIAAYFIIGTLVMVFHYKESGSNVIPNKSLWIQFPLLVKDGFLFTFGPCVTFIHGKVRGSQGYEKT